MLMSVVNAVNAFFATIENYFQNQSIKLESKTEITKAVAIRLHDELDVIIQSEETGDKIRDLVSNEVNNFFGGK